jgi:hypothetical protein
MSKAPNLSIPPKQYDQSYFEQLLGQLRTYFVQVDNPADGILTIPMGNTNQTVSIAQSQHQVIWATGVLTALRDIIVPLYFRQWTVYANVTGGFGVRIIGASGTGVTIADGKRAIVYADTTNVVRVTPDT